MAKNYINNKKLYEEIMEYKGKLEAWEKDNSLPKPKINEYIGEALLKIATRYAKKPRFAFYTYKDEMISDAVMICIRYLDRFDCEKSQNPFAYFTQIVHNAFFRRAAIEAKQTYVKLKSLELNENDLYDCPDSRKHIKSTYTHNDEIKEKIRDYEDRNIKKKAKTKPTILKFKKTEI